MPNPNMEFLLEVRNLKKYFPIHGGVFRKKIGNVYALDGVTLAVKPGETLGVVGESGCGKTTLGRCIIRLYKPTAGKIFFNNTEVSTLSLSRMRSIRRNLQMIFQDPFESLNARHTVKYILKEPFIIHGIGTPGEREDAVFRLMKRVGLQEDAAERFPHEFSGGQRQRIGIARAIALNPKLIVCDEPVSALDVSIQSQILNLLMELQEEMGITYVFIAHDLSVVKLISDFVAVMYLGKIVEYADARAIYREPLHPYTKHLIASIPVPDPTKKRKKGILEGDVPSPIHPPPGCRFHTRCPVAEKICLEEEPKLLPIVENHLAACHFAEKLS